MGLQAFLRAFPLFNFREGEIPQLEALSHVLRCAPPQTLLAACGPWSSAQGHHITENGVQYIL